MEIFVLAAISRGGLDTLYALQQTVGLQPGGLLPIIKRLLDNGVITRSEAAARRRKAMKLTDKGEEYLNAGWKLCLKPHHDLDSILRSTTVALFMDDLRSAWSYLLWVASDRDREFTHPVPRLDAPEASPLEFYADMKTVYDIERRATEAAVLRKFAAGLEEVIRKRDDNDSVAVKELNGTSRNRGKSEDAKEK
jgi:DNA-binding MarR family transcriptional regulator